MTDSNTITDPREVQIFAINNDTDMWAVIADSRFELFNTEAEADEVFEQLVDGDINKSCFGVVQILEPRHHSDEPTLKGEVRGNLSKHEEVDLLELKEARQALARDMKASGQWDKDSDAYTFEELCEMGILAANEENKKSYTMNMSKLQEWYDKQEITE